MTQECHACSNRIVLALTMLNRLRACRAASTISNISHFIAQDPKARTLTPPQTLQNGQANTPLSVPWLPWTGLGWEIGCVAVDHIMRRFARNVSTNENRESIVLLPLPQTTTPISASPYMSPLRTTP
ncbi:hypothetical protein HOY80DRAFT_133883 [Tuber brumale]|nr:hypothetical protein HOY80DRAFT_133883 [Tuber brumale]